MNAYVSFSLFTFMIIVYWIISELFTDFSFTGGISDEVIRQKLEPYGLGLLKLTKLTKQIKEFISITYNKYRAEGE